MVGLVVSNLQGGHILIDTPLNNINKFDEKKPTLFASELLNCCNTLLVLGLAISDF